MVPDAWLLALEANVHSRALMESGESGESGEPGESGILNQKWQSVNIATSV